MSPSPLPAGSTNHLAVGVETAVREGPGQTARRRQEPSVQKPRKCLAQGSYNTALGSRPRPLFKATGEAPWGKGWLYRDCHTQTSEHNTTKGP